MTLIAEVEVPEVFTAEAVLSLQRTFVQLSKLGELKEYKRVLHQQTVVQIIERAKALGEEDATLVEVG